MHAHRFEFWPTNFSRTEVNNERGRIIRIYRPECLNRVSCKNTTACTFAINMSDMPEEEWIKTALTNIRNFCCKAE